MPSCECLTRNFCQHRFTQSILFLSFNPNNISWTFQKTRVFSWSQNLWLKAIFKAVVCELCIDRIKPESSHVFYLHKYREDVSTYKKHKQIQIRIYQCILYAYTASSSYNLPTCIKRVKWSKTNCLVRII